ncbi:MAG: bifunctional pyr operon transcriptional regulator/uracil phosphoribosyltransferase PyrR [Candidatus Dormibacteria bacterium]
MSSLPQRLEGSHRVLDEAALARAITRLAHEVVERHPGLEGVVLAGVRTRGVPIAERLSRTVDGLGHPAPRLAALDLTDYRDDRPRPRVVSEETLLWLSGGEGHMGTEGATVIVVDDVFFTGRTLRAALEALTRHGRPACVELLVLVDRGHRELPVRATYVGKNIPTSPGQRVVVRLREVDGIEGAWLVPAGTGPREGDR